MLIKQKHDLKDFVGIHHMSVYATINSHFFISLQLKNTSMFIFSHCSSSTLGNHSYIIYFCMPTIIFIKRYFLLLLMTYYHKMLKDFPQELEDTFCKQKGDLV